MNTETRKVTDSGNAPSVFRGLRANQRIRFRVTNGQRLDLKSGRIIQEYKIVSAKVNPLLMFETHVVANYGSFGQVVNKENYIE